MSDVSTRLVSSVSAVSVSSGRVHVLVADEDEAIREFVRFHLELADLDLTLATDGLEALQLARERTFDLLILGLELTAVEGITLC